MIQCSNKDESKGFTAVELILVLAIIGILAAMAVPRTQLIIEDVREKALAERLIEDLTYIRSYAISNHDTTWLVVDPTLNQYGLYVGATVGTRTLLPDAQTGSPALLDTETEYPNIGISSADFGGVTELFYNWWGTPSAGGTIALKQRTVIVIAETGMSYEVP